MRRRGVLSLARGASSLCQPGNSQGRRSRTCRSRWESEGSPGSFRLPRLSPPRAVSRWSRAEPLWRSTPASSKVGRAQGRSQHRRGCTLFEQVAPQDPFHTSASVCSRISLSGLEVCCTKMTDNSKYKFIKIYLYGTCQRAPRQPPR